MSVSRVSALLIDIAACVFITAVAFCKRKTLRRMPMYILVYFAVSMALGGFMTAIFNLLNKADIPMEKETGGGISVLAFIFLAGISAVITLLSGRFFKSKSTERIIEVRTPYASEYKAGDRVVVALLNPSMGIISVIWSYVLPLVVLIATLFGCKGLGLEDGPSALVSIVAVAIYYVVLYLIRKIFERKIEFTIFKEF
jgi:sigma-E factor negative regulatory protein RseC